MKAVSKDIYQKPSFLIWVSDAIIGLLTLQMAFVFCLLEMYSQMIGERPQDEEGSITG